MAPIPDSALDRLKLIVGPAALERIGARVKDLENLEMRTAAVRADHPELEQALREGRDEVEADGLPVNVRLHLSVHEVLASQLADDDPVEVFQTAGRLLAAGYERHEVLHMLASPLAGEILTALRRRGGLYRQRHLAALQALPGSWERWSERF